MTRPLRNPLVLVAIGVTVVVALLPSPGLSYYAPSLRIALETASALAALTAAYVVFGRFRHKGTLDQMIFVLGLALLALASILVAAFVALEQTPPAVLVVALVIRLVAAWTLAAAAFLPSGNPRRRGRVLAVAGGGATALVAVLSVAFVNLSLRVPEDAVGRLADAGQAYPSRSWVIVLLQGLTLLGYLTAALGFARTAERTGDLFLGWVAVGATLAALARVQYIAAPPAGKYWFHTGDVFVLAFYCVLLFAAANEVRGYWRGLAETAILDERRRIARELHDGVAQELAFIARRARRPGTAEVGFAQIAAAAERALNDSRRAIAALTGPLDEPLDKALAQAVEEVAQRTGASLELELDEDVAVSAPTREALVRIACEAVGNAARHAGVDTVRLELRNGDTVLLRVVDEGIGFDPAAPPPSAGGFGLVAMRERAAELGADLRIDSRPGAGTTVEVELR